MRRLTNRQITLFLAAFALVALTALVVDAWAMGEVQLVFVGPAISAVAMLVAWPFVLGWRPFGEALRSCTVCGTQWSPRREGVGFCPACGGADASST